MISVNVKQLVSAIAEADSFRLPDRTEGTDYLYHSLYSRLAQGEETRLSEIDFERFEMDDVDSMRDLYAEVLEGNERRTESIRNTLRGLSPVAAAAAFQ